MDWSPRLKCWALAISSVTLVGLSAVSYTYVKRSAASRKKRRSSSSSSPSTMAAATEIDCSSNSPVSGLVSTMEQLKVAQPQPVNDEVIELTDRDSANHSPSDFLSGNLHSDSHSESSNDSGKGGSDCANTNGEHGSRFDVITPPLSPAVGGAHHHLVQHPLVALPERLFVYEFEIPDIYVGLLIGKFGAFVNQVRMETGASLLIRDRNKRSQLCCVEGTKSEIDAALTLIRTKFPPKKYPQVTLAQINVAPENASSVPVLPDSIQLLLPPETNCDVMISAVVAPNHVFLQQITHPTYPSLARLDHCMAQCYNEFVTPELPRPVLPNMICAAPSLDGWFRAKVVAVYPPQSFASAGDFEINPATGEAVVLTSGTHQEVAGELVVPVEEEDFEVDICFVDYGGYSRVMASSLRQIRADFMSLPFQAIECLLANVGPANEETGWTLESYEELENMTRERMLQGQTVAYSLEGLPLVYLYQMDQTEDEVLINRQLVNRGVAQWVEPQMVSN